MTLYEITTPDGNVLELEGDSPPTEQELEQVFAGFDPIKPAYPASGKVEVDEKSGQIFVNDEPIGADTFKGLSTEVQTELLRRAKQDIKKIATKKGIKHGITGGEIAATILFPGGAGVKGALKGAQIVGGVVGVGETAKELIDGAPVKEAISTGISRGATAAVLDVGLRGGMGLIGLAGKAVRGFSPVKLTREEFKGAAKSILGAGEEVTDHFLDNADDILKRKGLDNNAFIDNLAINAKKNLGAQKTKIGKQIEEAVKRVRGSNKTANVKDIADQVDEFINLKNRTSLGTDKEQLAILKNLSSKLKANKGNVSYETIDQLRKSINDTTFTKSGAPIVGDVESLLKKVRNAIVDRVDDEGYKAANKAYSELGNTTTAAFGNRNVFKNANAPEVSDSGIKAITSIRNSLEKIGQEKGALAIDKITIPGKAALKQFDNILPGSAKLYSEALDYNAYNVFKKPIEQVNLASFMRNARQGILRGTTGFTKSAEPVAAAAGKILPGASTVARRGILSGLNE